MQIVGGRRHKLEVRELNRVVNDKLTSDHYSIKLYVQ